MENWLRTDETQEAVISLEMVTEYLDRVTVNYHYWKWVIIGLHNTLQGFMVLALRGTNHLNVLREKDAQKWTDAYEQGKIRPTDLLLDSYLNLYKKIKSDRMNMYTSSIQFKPKGTQGWSIKKLNSLRNDFIHFIPKGWSIEISGLPRITQDCLDVIDFLAFDCGNIFWNESPLEVKTKNLLTKAKIKLVEIDTDLAVNPSCS